MLAKLRALPKPVKYLIPIVALLVAGTLAAASMADGPLFKFTPEDGDIPFDVKITDGNLITGAVAGVPAGERKANITAEEVVVQNGELEPIQITAKNLGTEAIEPTIDIVIIRRPRIKDILCKESFDENIIGPGDEISTEVELDCTFEEPGEYEMNVILIDENLNILKTARRYFTITEVCELRSE